MSSYYEQAVHRAGVWVADVTAALGTQDRHYGRRALRAWLHTLRDRLTVDAVAKFGQQLPELLRGTYYDGWEPSRAPQKFDALEYVQRFSAEAMVPAAAVPGIASAITYVISERMSPGQVAEALAELPAALVATIRDGAAVAAPAERPQPTPSASIEDRIAALTEAVRTLARGLEGHRAAGEPVDSAQVAQAARLADEILITAASS
jgi:uncharacterized protein (DUF2267 family)